MNTNNLILKKIHIPDIGDVSDVNIIEINVKIGDKVNIDDSILLLEASKASIEIPSPYNGIINEIFVKEGDKVSKDSLILNLYIEEEKSVNNKIEEEKSQIKSINNKTEVNISTINEKNNNINLNKDDINQDNSSQLEKSTSPLVRRMIRELNLNINEIKGSGNNNRILKEDINNFIKINKKIKIKIF